MRLFLMYIFLGLLLLTGMAYLLSPRRAFDGRTPLVWTTDANPQRDPQVETFNELYPHLKLRIDPDNMDTMKVVVQSSAGMGPDIIDSIGSWRIQTYHDAGILMDLTDYADEMGFGLDTLTQSLRDLVTLPVLMEDGTIQRRMFAYPCNTSTTILFYNKNVFDRAGIAYPSDDLTWDEYLDLARRLTVIDESRGIPEVFGAVGVQTEALLFSHGAEFVNEHGTRCTMDSPAFIDAMVFYHRLLHDLKVEPTPLDMAGVSSQGGWGTGFMNWFGEGRIGMFWGANWMMINFRRFMMEQTRAREAWLRANPGADPADGPQILRLGAVQIPRYEDRERRTSTGIRSASINAASPNRDEALHFMQFLASEPYSRLIAQGSDGLPGNKQFHEIENFMHPDWPGEEEVFTTALAAVPYGQVRRFSMLIDLALIDQEFARIRSNIQASPNLTPAMIAEELRRASARMNLLIARNIVRNPRMHKMYDALLATGAEPIVYNLDEVR